MKNLKVFLIVMFSITVLTTCEKTNEDYLFDETLHQNENPNESIREKSNGMISIPFKSNFYTVRNYENTGEGFCTEDPYLTFNYQVGGGNATHLGLFTVTMSFCGAGLDYANGTGTFVSANGDELHVQIPSEGEIGHVVPLSYEHPLYEFQFQDPFSFNGGTGRFEGATGGGMTNSFVDLFDNQGNFIPEHRTDHKWTGVLILPKE